MYFFHRFPFLFEELFTRVKAFATQAPVDFMQVHGAMRHDHLIIG
jgi:hypothetical protein